ncbi:uncharacterized protein LOC111612398 [Centruroides sculpturatus]|uniref:uncharacterized protein LOC111612398 n=1 Tax=Centruroides sculpturatus TaxID=218467 RepID=UPI000C6D1B48|nr:uncharacterized protein LOC111612398 [Centruroides sculpturatus]
MSSKNEKSDTARPRGGRLARRARSFKEDFFGRITQMRSPSGTRSGSPSKTLYSKSRNKGATNDSEQENANSGPGKVSNDYLLVLSEIINVNVCKIKCSSVLRLIF